MSDYSLSGKKVFVAGHRGMVGSAIVRRLRVGELHRAYGLPAGGRFARPSADAGLV